MKKSNFCFDVQMTNTIIKSVIAPPVCVFDNFQEVILDSVYLAEHSIQNNPKQFKTMAIVWDAALIYSVKTFHHGRHDNDANDRHKKKVMMKKSNCLIGERDDPVTVGPW